MNVKFNWITLVISFKKYWKYRNKWDESRYEDFVNRKCEDRFDWQKWKSLRRTTKKVQSTKPLSTNWKSPNSEKYETIVKRVKVKSIICHLSNKIICYQVISMKVVVNYLYLCENWKESFKLKIKVSNEKN